MVVLSQVIGTGGTRVAKLDLDGRVADIELLAES
jgi:hypothetical protein